MLSVFMTPWMKPTESHWAMSEAWRFMTAWKKSRCEASDRWGKWRWRV